MMNINHQMCSISGEAVVKKYIKVGIEHIYSFPINSAIPAVATRQCALAWPPVREL